MIAKDKGEKRRRVIERAERNNLRVIERAKRVFCERLCVMYRDMARDAVGRGLKKRVTLPDDPRGGAGRQTTSIESL